jgi:hypothetical protein
MARGCPQSTKFMRRVRLVVFGFYTADRRGVESLRRQAFSVPSSLGQIHRDSCRIASPVKASQDRDGRLSSLHSSAHRVRIVYRTSDESILRDRRIGSSENATFRLRVPATHIDAPVPPENHRRNPRHIGYSPAPLCKPAFLQKIPPLPESAADAG